MPIWPDKPGGSVTTVNDTLLPDNRTAFEEAVDLTGARICDDAGAETATAGRGF